MSDLRRLPPQTIAEQLRAFNEERLRAFGRGPRPDDRLPLPATGVGGDVEERGE